MNDAICDVWTEKFYPDPEDTIPEEDLRKVGFSKGRQAPKGMNLIGLLLYYLNIKDSVLQKKILDLYVLKILSQVLFHVFKNFLGLCVVSE